MLSSSEPNKGQVIVGILLLKQPSRSGHDFVHHVGVGLSGLSVKTGFDGGAISIKDETTPHRFGLAQVLELLLYLSGHCGVGRHSEERNRGEVKIETFSIRKEKILFLEVKAGKLAMNMTQAAF